jgi:2-phosphosulfolactate phosphatase
MNSVVIDCLPECVARYASGYAVVAIDVIRATTTLVTAVASGRRCYVATSVETALARAACLDRALLVGELGGEIPGGFDLTNSPAALALRADQERPIVLVSSSGTQLLHNARCCDSVYLACFRNHRAVAEHLAGRHAQVAVIGAGTRGEFREEDQMCCAWIAGRLIERGYVAENSNTRAIVSRWQGAPVEACLISKSVDYLVRSKQLDDLDFVLSHVNDLAAVHVLDDDEVVHADLGACAAPMRNAEIAGLLQRREGAAV